MGPSGAQWGLLGPTTTALHKSCLSHNVDSWGLEGFDCPRKKKRMMFPIFVPMRGRRFYRDPDPIISKYAIKGGSMVISPTSTKMFASVMSKGELS